ncbi:MAG: hypothetical protein ACI8RZ_006602 [Myxococcota bacterium]|jgi:hypothetical protein
MKLNMLVPNTKGKKLIFPGRSFLQPSPRKLPTTNKAFKNLCDFFQDEDLAFGGSEPWLSLAKDAIHQLRSGVRPTSPNQNLEALRWVLLARSWKAAWEGTPKVLTRSKREVAKLTAWWVSIGGPAFAVRTLVGSWQVELGYTGEISLRDAPYSSDIRRPLHYLERLLPGMSALLALRLLFASLSDEAYAEGVNTVRELLDGLPTHLQAALIFLVPTEEDLALRLLDQLEQEEGENWPDWIFLIAWSLSNPDAFERIEARSCDNMACDASIGFACQERAPDRLGAARRKGMVYWKYATEEG